MYAWKLAILISLFLCMAQLSADETDGFSYVEPISAERLENSPHARFIVYFCGHCPGARKRMQGEVKALAESIQQHKAPIDLVCVTPDLDMAGVKAYAESVGMPKELNVNFAVDTVNAKKISLKNIMQTSYRPGKNGRAMSFNFTEISTLKGLVEKSKQHAEIGAYRNDPAGMSDEKLRLIWWEMENLNPASRVALIKARKKAKAGKGAGDQIIAFHDAIQAQVEATLNATLENATDDFASYEKIEAAVVGADGFTETKGAGEKLKALKKDKAIAKELKVRSAYEKCAMMMQSNKAADKEKAVEGMKFLAGKYPDTVYGKKAASY